jgi:ribosomal protein L34E
VVLGRPAVQSAAVKGTFANPKCKWCYLLLQQLKERRPEEWEQEWSVNKLANQRFSGKTSNRC